MSTPVKEKVCSSCSVRKKWGVLSICSHCVWEHVLVTLHEIVWRLGVVGVLLFPFSLYSVGFWLVNGSWPDPVSLESLLVLSNFSFLVNLEPISGFAQLWLWLVTKSFASLSTYLILGWVISARALTLLLELEVTKGAIPWFIPRNPFTGLAITSQRDLSSDQNYPPKGFQITVIVSVQFSNRNEENVGSRERPLICSITKHPHIVQLCKVIEHFPYVPPKGSVIATFSHPLLHHWPMVVTSSVLDVKSVNSPSDQVAAVIHLEPTRQRGKEYTAHDEIIYFDDFLYHFLDAEGYQIADHTVILEVLHGLEAAKPDQYHRQKLKQIAERSELKPFQNPYKVDDKK